MVEEKRKAMVKDLACPGKQLDFNVRLLSTKRPSGHTDVDQEMCCSNPQGKFQDTSDRIPFFWEQAPGKPKDSNTSDKIHDFETPRLRMPPGRWHKQSTSNTDELHLSQAQDDRLCQDDGCDGDVDDDDDDCDDNGGNNQYIFSEEGEVLSLTEAIDIVEKAEKSHGLDGFNLESLGTNGSISPSYIIDRFLPDAAAIAASSVFNVPKNLSKKIPYSNPQACVPQSVRRSYSNMPKGCGLEMLFPWRMKHKICGVKRPVRQENSANVQPDKVGARNKSKIKDYIVNT